MKDDHSRGVHSTISAFPPGIAPEMDEKAALRAQSQGSGREAKVRLPAYVPRSKEEEWELTKNVWSNLANFVIHDPNFVPGTAAAGTDSKHSETLDHEKMANGGETTKDGSGTTTVSPESGGTNNNNNSHNSKSRTHLEESVKRSLHPKVTLHETEEYERYTRQFKSIRFDSAPTKGAAAYGAYMHANPRDEWSIGGTGQNTAAATSLSESVPLGPSNVHQQQQPHLDKSLPAPHSSAVRPSLEDARRMQNGGSSTSTITIGSGAYLDEDEDEGFYPSVSRSGGDTVGRNGMPTQISASGSGNINHFTNSYVNEASTLSSLSPSSQSKTAASLPTAANHAATATGRQRPHQAARDDTTKPESEDHVTPMSDYLPEPPILAPMQTIIKPPSDSEMVLYNAHVELPKLTLYTVGQTSLDPYWGASSGTKARYEAYKTWIHKGRYGNMTMPTDSGAHTAAAGAGSGGTAHGAGAGAGHGANHTGGKGSKTTEGAVFTGVSNSPGPHHHHSSLRRGSSAIYPTVDEKLGSDMVASSTIVNGGKDIQQHAQTIQQNEVPKKERRKLNGFGFSLG